MPDDELYRDWARRLRDERQRQGMTQRDLSARSGLSQQMVSNVERGTSGGGDDTRRALARALGMRPVDLFPYPEDLQPATAAGVS